ncbi:MAG TPA: hypothetical protein VMV10_26810 [Pirellulales bacterium]|nr:hypothetical protein [Pirellulales bacterium]
MIEQHRKAEAERDQHGRRQDRRECHCRQDRQHCNCLDLLGTWNCEPRQHGGARHRE